MAFKSKERASITKKNFLIWLCDLAHLSVCLRKKRKIWEKEKEEWSKNLWISVTFLKSQFCINSMLSWFCFEFSLRHFFVYKNIKIKSETLRHLWQRKPLPWRSKPIGYREGRKAYLGKGIRGNSSHTRPETRNRKKEFYMRWQRDGMVQQRKWIESQEECFSSNYRLNSYRKIMTSLSAKKLFCSDRPSATFPAP